MLQPPVQAMPAVLGLVAPAAGGAAEDMGATRSSHTDLVAVMRSLAECLCYRKQGDVPPRLYDLLIEAFDAPDRHFAAVVLGLYTAAVTGRSDLIVNGIFGAGKTRVLALILAFFAHYGRVKVVVVAKENVALRSLCAYLADFIPVSRGLEAPKIVGRFCGAED